MGLFGVEGGADKYGVNGKESSGRVVYNDVLLYYYYQGRRVPVSSASNFDMSSSAYECHGGFSSGKHSDMERMKSYG